MNSMIRRVLLLICVAAMFGTAFSLAGCGNQKASGSENGTTENRLNPAENGTTADGNTADPFPIEKFGTPGHPVEYTIIARSEPSDYLVCENDQTDFMNQQTYARNMKIEELFNVSLVLFEGGHSSKSTFPSYLENEYMSQDGKYDLVCPAWWWGTDLQGYYQNILDFDREIDLADPWWFQGINDNLIFAGYASGILGDAQFDTYYNIEAIFYNKAIAEEIGLTDPYSYVDDMKWTLEVVNEWGKKAAKDVDGDGSYLDFEPTGSKQGGDRVGSMLHKHSVHAALYGLGQVLAQNENGDVTLTIAAESNYDRFKALFNFCNETPENYLHPTADTIDARLYTPFLNNRVLFLWQAFRNGPALLKENMTNFGILPLPMYNEEQGKYITSIYDMTTFNIMVTAKNPHMSATILNAMNALTDEYMTQNYFDRVIPLIRNSLYCDFMWINVDALNWGSEKYKYYIVDGKINVMDIIKSEYEPYYEAGLKNLRMKMLEFRDREWD